MGEAALVAPETQNYSRAGWPGPRVRGRGTGECWGCQPWQDQTAADKSNPPT